MSSTDPSARKTEAQLEAFWKERFVPAAERLRAREVQFFATSPDAQVVSYWQPHDNAASPFVEIGDDAWPKLLQASWQAEGFLELADLVPALAALAGRLEPPDEEAGDVSPFMYVMF